MVVITVHTVQHRRRSQRPGLVSRSHVALGLATPMPRQKQNGAAAKTMRRASTVISGTCGVVSQDFQLHHRDWCVCSIFVGVGLLEMGFAAGKFKDDYLVDNIKGSWLCSFLLFASFFSCLDLFVSTTSLLDCRLPFCASACLLSLVVLFGVRFHVHC